ncbi:MAG: TAXI family TRAP transporter solute-binding subunit, partial [Nitrososphaerales archaeon]
ITTHSSHFSLGIIPSSTASAIALAVVCIYPEVFHLVVRKDSGIKSFEDIKGKIISIGPVGSGTTENMLEIMEIYGLSVKDLAKAERLSDTEAVDYFKDGRIHGVVVVSGLGVAMIKELCDIVGANIITIPKDMREKIKAKYPFFVDVKIPAGTYTGVGDIESLAIKAVLVCREDIPDIAIYTLIKTLLSEDGLKQFYLAHAAAKYLTRGTALEGISIPLHPGAERYYKEAGIPIPPIPV